MKVHRGWLGIVMALAVALLSITGAQAQDATPVGTEPVASPMVTPDCGTLLRIGTPTDSCLTFINALAGESALDLYVDGLQAVEELTTGDVSGYFALPEGSYTFDLVPAGASIEDSVFSAADVAIDAGVAYELAGIGTMDAPQLLVSAVDLSPLPPGQEGTPLENTRIRAIHASPDTGTVDVSLIGGDIAERAFEDLSFGQVSDPIVKLAGTYRVVLNPTEGDVVTIDFDEMQFDGESVNSIYLISDVQNGGLQLLGTTVHLDDGVSTKRAVPPTLVSEIVNVSQFSIYEGGCSQLSGQVAYELTGTGYDGTGPGTLAPWGSDGEAAGALGATPVLYGEGLLDDLNLGDLLGGRTVSVVVHDAATGGVVACGEVGGVVEKADHFWQHDRLIVGLYPVGEFGIAGTATFTEDTGILTDKVNVSVSLVTESDQAIDSVA